ncbi:MAG: protein kinase [Myxococcales bacterium]|nr:protein kinase [Myxococcales bacterium]
MSDLDERLAAAGRLEDSLDERQRQARIQARLFGEAPPVYIDRYRVGDRLGAGAMGTVFAAHDERLDRAVAVKVLRERGDSAAARMLREARALARLSHPHVVTVHEVGQDGDRTFIVMEFVPGTTLAEWQRGRPWRAVLEAYLAAGRGLAAVHAAGLVHRDFKPSNVLVGEDGRVRVADFGLVRAADAVEAGPAPVDPGQRLTASGALVGTPAYMAPEQLRGQSADKISDLFAFSASLYEALAGVRPFVAPEVEAVLARMEAGPPPLPRPVPAGVADAIARGLAHDPARRWASLEALLAALEHGARRRAPWLVPALARGVIAGLAAWSLRTAPTPATPTAPALPAALRQRPDLAARVLALRAPADAAWRQAALEVLGGPVTEQVLRPARGPVSDLQWLGPDDWLLRFMDGTAERWTAGASSPWPGPTLAAACRPTPEAPALPASFVPGSQAGALACAAEGLVDLGPTAATLYPFAGPLRPLGALPAGGHLLTPDGRDILTRVDSGEVLRQTIGSAEPPAPLAGLAGVQRMAAGGAVVAFAQADGHILTWQAGGRPRRVARMDHPAGGLLVSPSGQWLLAWVDGFVRVWDLEVGGEPMQLPGSWRLGVGSFDASGRWLVLVSADSKATLWNLQTEVAHPLVGHSGIVASARFSGGRLVTGGGDGEVRLWTLEGLDGELVGRHRRAIWAATLDPAGDHLATAGMDGVAWIWPLRGGAPVALIGHEKPVFSVHYSRNGARLATGSGDETARVWTSAGAPVATLPGHEGWAYGLDFSPDGRWLATGSRTGVIRLWPAAGGAGRILGDHGGPDRPRRVHTVAFSPDGAWLASAAKSGEVRLWPMAGGPPRLLPPHAGNGHLLYLPDGTLLTLGADADVRQLTTDGGRVLRTLHHPAAVGGVAASADGRWLATSVQGGDVFVWSLADAAAPPRRLGPHAGHAEFLAFDAPAARLLVGTSTGDLRLWRLDDGTSRPLPGHFGGVRFVGFDPAGVPLSAGNDGAVRRWPVDEDEATLRARLARATRVCPTADERAAWFTPAEAAQLGCAP